MRKFTCVKTIKIESKTSAETHKLHVLPRSCQTNNTCKSCLTVSYDQSQKPDTNYCPLMHDAVPVELARAGTMSHKRASPVGHLAGHYTKVVALTFYLENYDTIETCLDVENDYSKAHVYYQRL